MSGAETRVRVVVVGAGWWGREHARAFSTRSDTELCAIVARDPDRTAARASEFGVRSYTDLDEMIETEAPDLVSICLPNTAHVEPTLHVLRAGIPVLAEKPLAFDLVEADELLATARAKDAFFAINFNHRYAVPVRMAKKAIDRAGFGAVTFASWRFGGEGSSDHHPHANLIETQCHGFDMLEHLCGPIASVSAAMSDTTRPGRFTTLSLALTFASGAVGSLVGSYDSSYAYRPTCLLEVNGTGGNVVVEDTVARYSYQSAGDPVAQEWRASYFDDRARTFVKTFDRHLDKLLPALVGGEPPPVHAAAGRRALELAWAAIDAFESGHRVDVPVPHDVLGTGRGG